MRLSLLKRDERVSDHKVCQPNQRAGGDDGRCTGGKNADSIKKEDRVYLGIEEQAAHRWSSYRPISKSVQVAFFLVVPQAALETIWEEGPVAYVFALQIAVIGVDATRVVWADLLQCRRT